ncbi:hypothetical protein [Acinetobacter towneri]|uniref:hypothetical protein n=1 Tax=Acinetobacter towneri TaxID=202956 RepID=UPI001CE0F13C|nr:hypothetical protein [Acinetobacter towneri]MCA4791189.1 hypothetical protein [Acinetobacter towneri]
MAGRPQKILTEQDVIDLYEYLTELDFLRLKEKKCLQMICECGFKNLTSEQQKLVRETQYLMNRAVKNFDLLHEIQLQQKHSSTEKQILELCEKNDIDSYFSMHDLLDALRKKNDAKFAENKIQQKLAAKNKEKSPKKSLDSKKYFIGDLCLKWIESTFQNLSDDQVLDALNRMIENQKIGQEARKFWEQNNQNKDYLNTQIAATSQLKAQVNAAKTDSRNPFKKK